MENSQKEKFSQSLNARKLEVQQCQEHNSVTSCMKCSKILGCETRANYVKSVYESMSLGETGGFEF